MEDCLFCKIVKGEVPSEKIYEDENVYAFKDIHPVAPVHILVIPKKHYTTLLDIEDTKIIGDIYSAINKIAKQEGIAEEGFRVIVNCGENGGQVVMHVHFHLIAGKKLGAKICN